MLNDKLDPTNWNCVCQEKRQPGGCIYSRIWYLIVQQSELENMVTLINWKTLRIDPATPDDIKENHFINILEHVFFFNPSEINNLLQ